MTFIRMNFTARLGKQGVSEKKLLPCDACFRGSFVGATTLQG